MMLDHGDMTSPMFLTPPTDVQAVVYEGLTMLEQLEPRSVPMPESLQKFVSRTGWASNALMPGEYPSHGPNWGILPPPGLMPDDTCWSMLPPAGLLPDATYLSIAPPPGLLPEEVVGTNKAWGGVEHPQKPKCLQQAQEEISIDQTGTLQEPMAETAIDCEPAHKELGMEVARLSLKQSAQSNRWWTMPRYPMVCPLSGFPVNLLPYPPFKLRQTAADPNPHSLVDSKFFALLLISSGSLNVNGRCLEQSEVDALGKHIHRCKLGSHRPDIAFSLAEKAQDEGLTECQRADAMQALGKMRAAAKCELGKLRRIQEQRLFQLHDKLTSCSDGAAVKKPTKPKSSEGSRKSAKNTKEQRSKTYSNFSVSTCSLSSGGSSSESEDN
mmetsp:Transcript_72521/g.125830  ORF Transcript_72521/g.125830 Transcript_72521/m.125830 type:complete len:383 (+) Transcript_72521:54-1202(+)